MKIHHIKLNRKYADAVLDGLKKFEIRYNDRKYKLYDLVQFVVIDDNGEKIEHDLNYCTWIITYILSDFIGLSENYVAFSIQLL